MGGASHLSHGFISHSTQGQGHRRCGSSTGSASEEYQAALPGLRPRLRDQGRGRLGARAVPQPQACRRGGRPVQPRLDGLAMVLRRDHPGEGAGQGDLPGHDQPVPRSKAPDRPPGDRPDRRAGRMRPIARLFDGLRAAGLDPADSFHWDPNRPPFPGLTLLRRQRTPGSTSAARTRSGR